MRVTALVLLSGWGMLVPSSPAAATLLYDVDFERPADVAGSPPPLDTGPSPRSGPSALPAPIDDQPLVATGAGPFAAGTRVLRFEDDGGLGAGEWARFDLPERIVDVDVDCLGSAPFEDCLIFDPELVRYEIAFDVSVLGLGVYDTGLPDGFGISADFAGWPETTPPILPGGYRRLSFFPDGSLTAFANGEADAPAGSFAFGALLHVEMTVDYATGEWIVALDGDEVHRGGLASPNLSAFRLTSTTRTPETVVLVDDVRITAVPEPARALLALALAAALLATGDARRRSPTQRPWPGGRRGIP